MICGDPVGITRTLRSGVSCPSPSSSARLHNLMLWAVRRGGRCAGPRWRGADSRSMRASPARWWRATGTPSWSGICARQHRGPTSSASSTRAPLRGLGSHWTLSCAEVRGAPRNFKSGSAPAASPGTSQDTASASRTGSLNARGRRGPTGRRWGRRSPTTTAARAQEKQTLTSFS